MEDSYDSTAKLEESDPGFDKLHQHFDVFGLELYYYNFIDLVGKKNPIKTVILDQSIIVGIGNIYADEILFLSNINPFTKASELDGESLQKIIDNTRRVLTDAIKMGGTTIRTYTSSEGVHGRFQQNLLVHNHEGDLCPVCKNIIVKVQINGRGTYYCEKCQNN